MNTEYINKSNQVWDTMESERWIYNLDGEEGIVPTVKKSKPKTYLEINEDESWYRISSKISRGLFSFLRLFLVLIFEKFAFKNIMES